MPSSKINAARPHVLQINLNKFSARAESFFPEIGLAIF
jgi:hypothetical protein